MLRTPRRSLQCVNNVTTVSLPLTGIDVNKIVNKAIQIIGQIKLSELSDVDTESYGLQDGSILIYNVEKQMWQSRVDLLQQHIDAGSY